VLKSSHRSVKERTLKSVESQINLLTGVLRSSEGLLRFSDEIEQDYLKHRNQRFLDVDLKIIAGGLVVYMLFAWSDFYLGGDRGSEIFTYRAVIAATLFTAVFTIPRTPLYPFIVPITAVGITIVGASVIYFIYLLEGVPRYAYHLGLVPIQVFAMVSMRLSYRCFLAASLSMLLIYGLATWLLELNDNTELGMAILTLQPYFIAFWLVMIMLGGYLAYAMESAFRADYMKNRLLALEAQRLHFLTQKLQQLSTTDSLTQVANRRHFEQLFAAEWRRCQRSQEPVSLVMIDIDAFKEFNDTYGHPKGDDCLRRVAERIHHACRRPADLCARYGGEEFVLLLPGIDQQAALELAERVRADIEQLAIRHKTTDIGVVTISAGVATEIPQDNNSERLIKRADKLLYQAKKEGRNRVFRA